MTFHSKATTPQEFRQELLDYLQRLATQHFNKKRALQQQPKRQLDIDIATIQFHQICEIRDFLTQIQFPGDTP